MMKPHYMENIPAANRDEGDCSFADWFWPVLSIIFCTIFMLLCFFAPGSAGGPSSRPEEVPSAETPHPVPPPSGFSQSDGEGGH